MAELPVPLGAHVDAASSLDEARAVGVRAVQIFLGDPQGWKKPLIDFEGGAAAFREAIGEAGITAYVHAPYVINVASTNNRIRIPSRKLLNQSLHAAAEIGAAGLIVHGGHVTADDEPGHGYENWYKAVEGAEIEVPLLIENTAGGSHAMARRLDALDHLWAAISAADGSDRVGFCLDICHAFAAGLDLTTVVDDVRAITGRIDLVHLNDSRGEAGSGADRHASLGAGLIDPDILVGVVRAAGVPAILETPGGIDERRADLAWVRDHLGPR
ncbi:deoxyribonuclease IV [Raineyella fluvialis]|uniref:Deoxyribonuclease IV n=1 Tax=Raineyella fluvialis TaxID=2662261 RepID=A0A5Q2F8Q9_9ACTN|nr:deoxyribonuclease IV [Raineyella fluvialis]QGF23219.1 deoxyribonuclease IV [Raineyella fluvialis]